MAAATATVADWRWCRQKVEKSKSENKEEVSHKI
jgi:hypothetical protein